MYKNELEIDVSRCIKALIKNFWFIAVVSILFFVYRFGLTMDEKEDKYSAVATVYAAADNSYTDATNAVTAMNAYLDVATSYKVCQRAALIMGRSDIDAGDIQKAIEVNSSLKQAGSSSSVSNFMNSSATIISFVATTSDSELCKAMADAMAESYTIEMANILKTDAVKNLDSAGEAYLSLDASMNAWSSRISALFLGVVVGCIIVVAFEIFDPRVRSLRDGTVRDEIPIIGIIPDYKE